MRPRYTTRREEWDCRMAMACESLGNTDLELLEWQECMAGMPQVESSSEPLRYSPKPVLCYA